jgi:TPR repeat protein
MGYLMFGEKRVDFRAACEWLHRAAAQDHAEALFDLSRVDELEDRRHSWPYLFSDVTSPTSSSSRSSTQPRPRVQSSSASP